MLKSYVMAVDLQANRNANQGFLFQMSTKSHKLRTVHPQSARLIELNKSFWRKINRTLAISDLIMRSCSLSLELSNKHLQKATAKGEEQQFALFIHHLPKVDEQMF